MIDLGLKFYRDGLKVPYCVLLRLIDTTSIDMRKSVGELDDVIDQFEELIL